MNNYVVGFLLGFIALILLSILVITILVIRMVRKARKRFTKMVLLLPIKVFKKITKKKAQ